MTHLSSYYAPPALTDQAVLDYLRQRPDFFERHPEALEQALLQRQGAANRPLDDGEPRVVSLVTRQFQQLRQENQQLQTRLQAVVAKARQHRQQSLELTQFAWQLGQAMALDAQVALIYATLTRLFPETTARLCVTTATPPPQGTAAAFWVSQTAFAAFDAVMPQSKPLSGRLTRAQTALLFGDQPSASAVLMALHGNGWRGVLAVGSGDEQQFLPDQPLYFLHYLADYVVAALDGHYRPPVSPSQL